MTRSPRERSSRLAALDADEAFIALLIAAMDASGHVSPEEAERAHHIIWSMRRFRHRSGDAIGRKIQRMKSLIEDLGSSAVLDAASRKIPARLRRVGFAVAADLVLVDGRMERSEARFLRALATDLGLSPDMTQRILEVIRIKNSA